MKTHLLTVLLSVSVSIAALSMNSTMTYTQFAEANVLMPESFIERLSGYSEVVPEIFLSENIEELSAESVLVVEATTGKPVYEKNADEVRPIASISKLFTAQVVLAAADMEEKITVTKSDVETEGYAGALRPGEKYTFREMLFPLLLTSSNDAGAALMRELGKEAFLEGLEHLYKEVGLSDTHLVESTGLSPENRSTARELAAYVLYLKERAPYILSVTQLPSYEGKLKGWENNITAVDFDSFQGGKHGYIPEAGSTFVGLFERDGTEFVVVLLKSDGLRADLSLIADMLE